MNFILEQHNCVHPDPMKRSFETMKITVCTKCCLKIYEKMVRNLNPKLKVPWNQDGPKVWHDPISSQAILLNMMANPVWWAKFSGDNKKGKSKNAFARELSEKIKESGIVKNRSPKDILNWIGRKHDQFRRATDWRGYTEQGVLRDDGKESFEDGCKKYLPEFFVATIAWKQSRC